MSKQNNKNVPKNHTTPKAFNGISKSALLAPQSVVTMHWCTPSSATLPMASGLHLASVNSSTCSCTKEQIKRNRISSVPALLSGTAPPESQMTEWRRKGARPRSSGSVSKDSDYKSHDSGTFSMANMVSASGSGTKSNAVNPAAITLTKDPFAELREILKPSSPELINDIINEIKGVTADSEKTSEPNNPSLASASVTVSKNVIPPSSTVTEDKKGGSKESKVIVFANSLTNALPNLQEECNNAGNATTNKSVGDNPTVDIDSKSDDTPTNETVDAHALAAAETVDMRNDKIEIDNTQTNRIKTQYIETVITEDDNTLSGTSENICEHQTTTTVFNAKPSKNNEDANIHESKVCGIIETDENHTDSNANILKSKAPFESEVAVTNILSSSEANHEPQSMSKTDASSESEPRQHSPNVEVGKSNNSSEVFVLLDNIDTYSSYVLVTKEGDKITTCKLVDENTQTVSLKPNELSVSHTNNKMDNSPLTSHTETKETLIIHTVTKIQENVSFLTDISTATEPKEDFKLDHFSTDATSSQTESKETSNIHTATEIKENVSSLTDISTTSESKGDSKLQPKTEDHLSTAATTLQIKTSSFQTTTKMQNLSTISDIITISKSTEIANRQSSTENDLSPNIEASCDMPTSTKPVKSETIATEDSNVTKHATQSSTLPIPSTETIATKDSNMTKPTTQSSSLPSPSTETIATEDSNVTKHTTQSSTLPIPSIETIATEDSNMTKPTTQSSSLPSPSTETIPTEDSNMTKPNTKPSTLSCPSTETIATRDSNMTKPNTKPSTLSYPSNNKKTTKPRKRVAFNEEVQMTSSIPSLTSLDKNAEDYVKTLEEIITKHNETIRCLRSDKSSLRKDLTHTKYSRKTFIKRFTITTLKNAFLKSKVKDLDDQVFADGEMMDMASQQLENVYAEMSDQRCMIDSLKDELEDSENDKNRLQNSMSEKDKIIATRNYKIADLQAEVDTGSTRINESNVRYEKATTRIDELVAVCADKDNQLLTNQQEIELLRNEKSRLEAKLLCDASEKRTLAQRVAMKASRAGSSLKKLSNPGRWCGSARSTRFREMAGDESMPFLPATECGAEQSSPTVDSVRDNTTILAPLSATSSNTSTETPSKQNFKINNKDSKKGKKEKTKKSSMFGRVFRKSKALEKSLSQTSTELIDDKCKSTIIKDVDNQETTPPIGTTPIGTTPMSPLNDRKEEEEDHIHVEKDNDTKTSKSENLTNPELGQVPTNPTQGVSFTNHTQKVTPTPEDGETVVSPINNV